MDDKIHVYIDSLKKQLEGLPTVEANEAVSYYEEYLNDAAEAGKDIDDILLQLGSPEAIAAEIKAEASIVRAQRSPGLKNYTKVMRYAFHGITTPLSFLFVSIFVIISYSIVITLFSGAFATLAGAVGAFSIAVYEAASMPSQYIQEIIGTIGIGLFSTGICVLVSLGLYKLGRLLIIASANVIRLIRKNSAIKSPEKSSHGSVKRKGLKRLAIIFTIITASGLVLFFASGLPIRYFTIFNSMKPQNTIEKTFEYNSDGISKISVTTAHSHIILEKGTSQKIQVRYEQPDWLNYECGVSGSMLSFYEKSNGRLSLFRLISLHESLTEVVISLPEGYSPEIVTLESTGGTVTIREIPGNVNVKTYTGDIELDRPTSANSDYNIKAVTGTGYIEVNGSPAGSRSQKGFEYYSSNQSKKTLDIISSAGSITINANQ